MKRPNTVIGLDLGGTNIKGLALGSDGRVLAEEIQPTADQGDERWRENVRAVFDALNTRCPAAAVGLCAPGLPTRDERAIAHMPGRLRGVENFRWSDWLGQPTVVLNDAHAALLGEVRNGAARGAENALMLTLGTGVGGAAIVDGRLLRGHLGRAGHFGHLSLNPAGTPDIAGTPGSLEDAIGDCTVAARSGGRFATTHALVVAATAGDSSAEAIWAESVRALAAALAGLINLFDPQIIVLGGGLAQAGEKLFAPLCAHLDVMEWRPNGTAVPIVPAALGANAGAIGAAHQAALMISSP